MQLTLGDISVKALSMKSQKLTHRKKMRINEDDAGSINLWEAGGPDLENGQQPQAQQRANQWSHSEGHVIFMPPL